MRSPRRPPPFVRSISRKKNLSLTTPLNPDQMVLPTPNRMVLPKPNRMVLPTPNQMVPPTKMMALLAPNRMILLAATNPKMVVTFVLVQLTIVMNLKTLVRIGMNLKTLARKSPKKTMTRLRSTDR